MLLGVGYLIGTATRQPTVVAISAPTQLQEAAVDMASRGGSMAPWLLFACSVLVLGLCMIGQKKEKRSDPIVDESLSTGVADWVSRKREAPAWTTAVARMAGVPAEMPKNALAYEHAHLNFEDRVQVLARPALKGDRIIT
ncbi:MAG: hypothetical protein BGP04_05510 [Rhizobiales bacterium 62-17]|nr:MAG: hypothetical protein BGP04_05510 [Rhizobiales bacterium 62-17]